MTNILVTAALLFSLHGAECDLSEHPRHGDHGRRYGIYQTGIEVVHDVNRFYGTHYVLKDADDRTKATLICTLYLEHWGREYMLTTGKIPTDEVLARIWNGGPTGWKRHATRHYWIARVLPYHVLRVFG